MSESIWTASIVAGIKDRLEDRLGDVLLLIAADGGSSVSAPVSFEVRDDYSDVSALPAVIVRTDGEVESDFLLPNAFRLQIPVQVVCVVSPEANPITPDDTARTYCRGIVNVLTETATVDDIAGLFFVGEVRTRIEQAGAGTTRKWRRAAIVEATAYVATTRELT